MKKKLRPHVRRLTSQLEHHMRYCRVCIRVPSMRSGFPICENGKAICDRLIATQQPQLDNWIKREGRKLWRKILKEKAAK